MPTTVTVAPEEGFGRHYEMSLPIAGIRLNPKLDHLQQLH
jgi:hypothetical protein